MKAMTSKKVLRELEKLEDVWVAITENEIMAQGDDAKRVLQEAKKRTKHEVTLFKVPRREEEAHIL